MGYYDRDDDSYTRTRDSSERSSNWRNESIFGRSNRRDDDGDWRTRRSTRGGSGNRNYQSRGSGDEGYRSEEHTSELQSLMRISYAVFCLKKKKNQNSTRE